VDKNLSGNHGLLPEIWVLYSAYQSYLIPLNCLTYCNVKASLSNGESRSSGMFFDIFK
jgi:hypothetical protein